ncbi:MAG: PepSY-associated TM helix domain-containing protein [Bacteroidota bacterium]
MKWRKINRIIHRDLGYFFFGMTIIYCLSGIALNHKVIDNWNSEYSITSEKFTVQDVPESKEEVDKGYAKKITARFDAEENFKNYYFPEQKLLKIFLEDGNITLDLETGEGKVELSKRRPVFYEVNYLHYNPNRWWTWFSDIFSGGLILIAISGLFILRGKKGIKGRGAWLTTAGILIPIIFLFFTLYS